MPTVPMFVALQPDLHWNHFLLDAKALTHRLVGDQLYLLDPPHLTVYLALFADADAVCSALESLVGRLGVVGGQLVGWHVFEADVLTGRNTLTCEIAEADRVHLRAVQRQVIDTLAPLRDVEATLQRYATRRAGLSAERQAALDACGFPFIGADWLPHFSVASILPNDWPPVWAALKERVPRGAFTCPALKLYRLDEGMPVLLHTFELGSTAGGVAER